MKVSNYIVEALREQGVGHLFIDLGGLNDSFMGPMTETEGITTVVAAFEGGAAYMADGYARASHGLGVCFGIGGPGVLNMVTALTSAGLDRSSLIAISGEVPRSWEGMGGFQDGSAGGVDDIDVLKPVTGLSISCSSGGVVPQHLRNAITHATTQRCPVHLSIPVDVQKSDIEHSWTPVPDSLCSARIIDDHALANVVSLLNDPENQNIVILAGPGVLDSGGVEALQRFAERFDIPVATTLLGKGIIADDHPLSLGVFGYGGSRWAIDSILSEEVDILLVIGSHLGQRDTMQWDPKMLPSKALIHVDADPLLIGRTWAGEVPLVSNPAEALERLADMDNVESLEAGAETRRTFLKSIRNAGSRLYEEQDTTSDAVPMHPARVITDLRAVYPDDGVLCVDSGAHRAWCAEYWSIREPDTHYSLANLGPMGGAIPLAIGAKFARPDRPMMVVTGDGCMLMHGMEIHTAAREKLPIVIAVMNNHSYGNIYYRASKVGPEAVSLTDIPGIDWVHFATSMGGSGERIDHPDQIPDAMARALAYEGPYLLDLHVDKTYPTPVGPWRERIQHWEDND